MKWKLSDAIATLLLFVSKCALSNLWLIWNFIHWLEELWDTQMRIYLLLQNFLGIFPFEICLLFHLKLLVHGPNNKNLCTHNTCTRCLKAWEWYTRMSMIKRRTKKHINESEWNRERFADFADAEMWIETWTLPQVKYFTKKAKASMPCTYIVLNVR